MSESSNAKAVTSDGGTGDAVRHFLDVPMKITIQLAQCNMKVRDILQWQPDSIVELPKFAGENVDILVNERTVAFGEVLELEGCTGIRLTDLNMPL